ncbi:hypothetical protein CNMCM8980_003541 [Aspergillus fumigatiaffinis]|uniref:Secreted protein n=1 Tax=Aspergillus fumigatiaffinis TaxID=340414 RepID=A0A8H4H9H4_9EURO|nr:hypothetical protein CNMCM5878_006092 [Aspergillus fumigatiaffinis]KAF4239708.1 hypothetical protein CNMCM6457_008628 [Aspergillus fumigatiaffinis]KAF4245602.1 hypothetical protein CNMCM6805_003546 [Aspergillus fumigatiaffinis]KAF4251918.1 hypothetical protein CNMCM8980_003541 [Aspergillus fumigatiaffinis]
MATYPNLTLLSLLSLCSAARLEVEPSPDAVTQPRAICTPTTGGSSSDDDARPSRGHFLVQQWRRDSIYRWVDLLLEQHVGSCWVFKL